VIQANAAYGAQSIGDDIPDAGISERNKILVNLVAKAIESSGYNADQNQHTRIGLDLQGPVSPVKQNPQNGIGKKMQQFVAEFKRGDVFDGRMVRLDVYNEAINEEWKPIECKSLESRCHIVCHSDNKRYTV
jgi:hypothetical protein